MRHDIDTNADSTVRQPRRALSKSTNSLVFGAGKVGTRDDEIHLFLGNNRITGLPGELFNLDALVVLSLRKSTSHLSLAAMSYAHRFTYLCFDVQVEIN